ncbi:MAG: HAD family phosphatase [Clostridia bacterium]|nr:HAD family phosphatase [Clostridia bacterium]
MRKLDIKLVALDLDGTLLNSEYQLSPKTKQVVQSVKEAGIMVTLATGRMYPSAVPYARELAIDLPLITYQGAVVRRLDSPEVLYQRLLPLGLARQVIEAAQGAGYAVNAYIDDNLYVSTMSPAAQWYAKTFGVEVHAVGDLARYLPKDVQKILVMGSEEDLDHFWEASQEKWGEHIYITKSHPNFLEFMNPEATKGRALRALASMLGTDLSSALALGDSYNDIEMFGLVGIAVAMGNAKPKVKEAADFIAPPNDDDGAALALEELLLGGRPVLRRVQAQEVAD